MRALKEDNAGPENRQTDENRGHSPPDGGAFSALKGSSGWRLATGFR
jgi:hypothetical protein